MHTSSNPMSKEAGPFWEGTKKLLGTGGGLLGGIAGGWSLWELGKGLFGGGEKPSTTPRVGTLPVGSPMNYRVQPTTMVEGSAFNSSDPSGFGRTAEAIAVLDTLHERTMAFDYGIDQFCKEANFDEEDKAALVQLMKLAAPKNFPKRTAPRPIVTPRGTPVRARPTIPVPPPKWPASAPAPGKPAKGTPVSEVVPEAGKPGTSSGAAPATEAPAVAAAPSGIKNVSQAAKGVASGAVSPESVAKLRATVKARRQPGKVKAEGEGNMLWPLLHLGLLGGIGYGQYAIPKYYEDKAKAEQEKTKSKTPTNMGDLVYKNPGDLVGRATQYGIQSGGFGIEDRFTNLLNYAGNYPSNHYQLADVLRANNYRGQLEKETVTLPPETRQRILADYDRYDRRYRNMPAHPDVAEGSLGWQR